MPQPSILSVLRERAGLQPDDIAFTYTDYEQDLDGVTESLTWSQAYRRVVNVAPRGGRHGSVGDRAVILAPQGLDYIAAFLGAMQAGLIAVPLSVPQVGSHDERVSAVLADTSPRWSSRRPRSRRCHRVRRRVEHRRQAEIIEVDAPRPGGPRRLRPAGSKTHRHRLPAVHVRFDPRSGRSDDLGPQSVWPISSS